ncbi:MAG: hypothetical protein ACRDRL_05180, partial [Sciscionella sp.]
PELTGELLLAHGAAIELAAAAFGALLDPITGDDRSPATTQASAQVAAATDTNFPRTQSDI